MLHDIDDSYDSDFPYPHLDPPELNQICIYAGSQKAIVQRHMDATPHWSEMPPKAGKPNPKNWYDQDNAPESPLDQDWEDNEGNLTENKYA